MKKRAVNFELLRIISMIMIILLHSLSYGGTRELYTFGSFGYIITNVLRGFSYLGVNCFVMLTGWFMCDSVLRIKRVMMVWLQVVFYGAVSLVILYLISRTISVKAIASVLFPITQQSYWFVSCYVLLLVLTPILNFVINNSNEQQLRSVVVILISVFSIVPTFLPWSKKVTSSGTDIMWFITLYLSIAYLKRYGAEKTRYQSKRFGMMLMIGGVVSGVALDLLANGVLSLVNINIDKLFYYNNSTMFFIGSVGLFLMCKNLNSDRLPGWLLYPASTTFGIYLLHDNPLIRNIIWSKLGGILQNSSNIIINLSYCFAKVVLIFIFGMAVDFIRQFLFTKLRLSDASEKIEIFLRKIPKRKRM